MERDGYKYYEQVSTLQGSTLWEEGRKGRVCEMESGGTDGVSGSWNELSGLQVIYMRVVYCVTKAIRNLWEDVRQELQKKVGDASNHFPWCSFEEKVLLSQRSASRAVVPPAFVSAF